MMTPRSVSTKLPPAISSTADYASTSDVAIQKQVGNHEVVQSSWR
jgi:hypothetical protein